MKAFFRLPELSLGFGKKTAIGLSIGTSSIKLVELKKSRKTIEILHFGVSQVSEDAILNREIINSILVSESLQSLKEQIKPKLKSVCLGVSGNSVIIKKISLEVKSKKELEQQVFWEAEQYLPFDVSEVFLDYFVVSKNQTGNIEVIIVAIKQDTLETYSAVVSDSGFQAKIIDLDFFALEHVFNYNYPDLKLAPQCIVDIGASSAKILILQDGIPLFTKEALLGGMNLTQEIQKQLNVSYMDAEALKLSSTSSSTPKEVIELIEIMNENLATEIKRSLDLYQASSTGASIQGIFLSGGASLQLGLTDYVEKITSLPTEILNPFLMIKYNENKFSSDEIEKIAPISAIPVGLALRALEE